MMSSSSSDGDGTIIDPKESRIKNRGKSDIETLARTIDDRFQNRLRVTFGERKKFLDICFEIAKKEEESRNGSLSRFSKEGLVILVKELKGRISQKPRASRLFRDCQKRRIKKRIPFTVFKRRSCDSCQRIERSKQECIIP